MMEGNKAHLLKYHLDILVLYLSIYIYCYFQLLLHYILEANIVFLLRYIYLITLPPQHTVCACM